MAQSVFIIGATGKVGRTLVNQILDGGDSNPKRHANPTCIVGLASSSSFVYDADGIKGQECRGFIEGKSGCSVRHGSLPEILEKAGKSRGNLAFVDATAAGKEMTEFHLDVIRNTKFGIVTANKNPIALSDFSIFRALTEFPRRYGYRCSVMAGAGVVSFLRDLRDLDDSPTSIKGCFSGTLGYISSELEKGRPFSEIVREAEQKGYTEPDPRDDLNGLDVARKLVVLARTAGHDVSMGDVKLSKFIPDKYFADESIGEFMERAKGLDSHFREKMENAMKAGKTLRYVAEMVSNGSMAGLEVSLKEVPADSPLGALRGTLNKIVIVSEKYPERSPYTIEAPGAGLNVTAQNIRRDLLELLPERKFLI